MYLRFFSLSFDFSFIGRGNVPSRGYSSPGGFRRIHFVRQPVRIQEHNDISSHKSLTVGSTVYVCCTDTYSTYGDDDQDDSHALPGSINNLLSTHYYYYYYLVHTPAAHTCFLKFQGSMLYKYVPVLNVKKKINKTDRS